MHLTETQKEIVAFVETYLESEERAPSYEEIADGIDVARRAVAYQLDRLEEKGVVRRSRRNGRCIARSLELVA